LLCAFAFLFGPAQSWVTSSIGGPPPCRGDPVLGNKTARAICRGDEEDGARQ
jgi:hypothetical protein